MANLNKKIKSVKNQFDALNCLPLFEFEIANDDHLLVNLAMTRKGIEFRFDADGKKEFFSGDIIKTGKNSFLLKCDRYTDNLDSYLEQIHSEIMEGYIMPHNLMRH